MILIGVHSTMHASHAPQLSCYYLVLVCVCTPLPSNTPYISYSSLSQSIHTLAFNFPHHIQYHSKLHVCMDIEAHV